MNKKAKTQSPDNVNSLDNVKEIHQVESQDSTSNGEKVPYEPLDSVLNSAMQVQLASVAPNVNQTEISKENVYAILNRLCTLYGVNETTAFVAMALLFLKGAANKGAPTSMSVQVTAIDGQLVEVTKQDVMQCYSAVAKNNFVRRLAETLSTEICRFAEAKGLKGDLHLAANNYYVAKGEAPLNAKERAWANSFCQTNELIETEAPRIAKFLAQNYFDRFKKGKAKQVTKNKGSQNPTNKNKKQKQEKN